jgi:cell division protein ZapD
MFEIMDVASRADLKSDLLKELERHKAQLNATAATRRSPRRARRVVAASTTRSTAEPAAGQGRPALTANEWLMSIRSRISIPAAPASSTCPPTTLAAARAAAPARRPACMDRSLMPLAEALNVLLGLLRDRGVPHKVVAPGGQYQQSLPPAQPTS